MNFVDIHSHLIPAVDDGPATLDGTVAMLKLAFEQGTRKLVATPHMFLDLFGNSSAAEMIDHFCSMSEQLKLLAGSPGYDFLQGMEILLGAENYACSDFFEALNKGNVLTLNRSHYLLVEFPSVFSRRQVQRTIDMIRAAGYTPVIAHVERCRVFRSHPDYLSKLLSEGCLTQVNSGSFQGPIFSETRRAVWAFWKNDLISVVASDGHNTGVRSPAMGRIFAKLQKKDPARAEALFCRNPEWIITRKSHSAGVQNR